MLRALVPEPPNAVNAPRVPEIVRPLMETGPSQDAITRTLQDIAKGMGFDSFMCAAGTNSTPSREARTYVWTSLPDAWVRLYDQRAYIETDPRIPAAVQSVLPIIWERKAFPDTKANREFFDAAASFGNCSGIGLFLRNACHAPAVFFLNSGVTDLDEHRRRRITEILGDFLLVATYVYDLLLSRVVERCLPPPTQGRPLSRRERECLQLTARGMTSRQIGDSLGIGERTVHQHFSNLLSKLAAANRHEAIAIAAAAGLI